MKKKHPLFTSGATAADVSVALRLAEWNAKEEMTGFNAGRRPSRPFSSGWEFKRYKQLLVSNDAFKAMAPFMNGSTVFRVTLTGSKMARRDRRFHARGLRRFAGEALRQIDPVCVGWCANLHVDREHYLHYDITVVVRDEDINEFKRRARTVHNLGFRRKGKVRANSCFHKAQGTTPTDLQRSLDYTLLFDRFRADPERTDEAIAAVGIARASGFGQNRRSRLRPRLPRPVNPMNSKENSSGNGGSQGTATMQGTTSSSSGSSRKKANGSGTTARRVGRPRKSSHSGYQKGFRRDRETRVGRLPEGATSSNSGATTPRTQPASLVSTPINQSTPSVRVTTGSRCPRKSYSSFRGEFLRKLATVLLHGTAIIMLWPKMPRDNHLTENPSHPQEGRHVRRARRHLRGSFRQFRRRLTDPDGRPPEGTWLGGQCSVEHGFPARSRPLPSAKQTYDRSLVPKVNHDSG